MQVTLDIDQILQHVSPWSFEVTVGGKSYPTRRLEFSELVAMQSLTGKDIDKLVPLLDSLFLTKPDIHWELPVMTAFIQGYFKYFMLHMEQKRGADAALQVQSQWNVSGGSVSQ